MGTAADITRRGRVWAAVLEQDGRFRRRDVERTLRYQYVPAGAVGTRPSRETVKRALREMVALRILEHEPQSPYYELASTLAVDA